LLIVDCWLLIVDCWLLIVDCWLLIVDCCHVDCCLCFSCFHQHEHGTGTLIVNCCSVVYFLTSEVHRLFVFSLCPHSLSFIIFFYTQVDCWLIVGISPAVPAVAVASGHSAGKCTSKMEKNSLTSPSAHLI